MPNRFPPNYIIYAATGVVKPYIKNIKSPQYKKLMSSFALRRRKNSKTGTAKKTVIGREKSKQRQKNRTRTGAKKHNAEKEENTRAKAKKRTYGGEKTTAAKKRTRRKKALAAKQKTPVP